jgi:hypothetical protein
VDFTFMSFTNEMNPADSAGDAGTVLLTNEPVPAEAVSTDTPVEAPEEDTTSERKRKVTRKATDDMVAWFAACARCSYFLAGYRVEYGLEGLETVAVDSKAGWLSLSWSQSMCKLVRKSYGNRMDLDCYHYDGSCPECHRQFTYHADDNGDVPARFRIELRPRSGR